MRIIALASVAALCAVALGSQTVVAEEIQAHESRLKTRLDWTRTASKESHFQAWNDNYRVQTWSSFWIKGDRLLLAALSELGPNVRWKEEGDWWASKNSMEKQIRSLAGKKPDLDIDFDKRFECSGTACVPFTMYIKWSCVFYHVNDFAHGRPKSEGVLSRGGENDITLQGYYCRLNQPFPRAEIDEVIGSFYVDRD